MVASSLAGRGMTKMVDSTSDDRTVNNVMRHEYRVLSEEEKKTMKAIKDKGLEFLAYIETALPPSRERALAVTNLEQAVMWAVKGLTN